MSESPLPPSTIPQKRSASNDPPSAPPRTKLREKNVHRESREKKDTWKKREALSTGLAQTHNNSRESTTHPSFPPAPGSGKATGTNTPRLANGNYVSPGLVRYRLSPPQHHDYYGHRAPPMTVAEGFGELPLEFMSVNDHPLNRRGFRYTPCEASRQLKTLQYRSSDYEPFGPRINFEDMNVAIVVNKEGTAVTTEKGWRMARANIGVREGEWYYEAKIVNGIKTGEETEGGGHVRIGWARREAPLDAPVGFDAYSYGLRDQQGQKVHMSRPKEFAKASFVTGDVIGLHICLPSLEEQRNHTADRVAKSGDIVRDRLPIRFKNQLWFEHFEYNPTKELEDLMNPAPGSKPPPPPTALKGSFIKVYKNGEFLGTAWDGLYPFLPPASKPLATLGGRELDDGTLGYYPAVSVFKSGVAELNFGPDWSCPPNDLKFGDGGVRAVSERYAEQIAEDIVWDVVDEIDLLFLEAAGPGAQKGQAALPAKEQIKEMVMDDD